LQDATYVVGVLDWILAELVRIYSNVDAGATQAIIDDLVLREIPVIEEIAGQPVLSKSLLCLIGFSSSCIERGETPARQ
jgi:hypothetical protein